MNTEAYEIIKKAIPQIADKKRKEIEDIIKLITKTRGEDFTLSVLQRFRVTLFNNKNRIVMFDPCEPFFYYEFSFLDTCKTIKMSVYEKTLRYEEYSLNRFHLFDDEDVLIKELIKLEIITDFHQLIEVS